MKRREFIKAGLYTGLLLTPAGQMGLFASTPTPNSPMTDRGMQGTYSVTPISPGKVQSFDLQDVTLLDGPFKDSMLRDRSYLLSLEADRLLHNFRTNAGLAPKGDIYGGWESQGVAGHCLGHYLSAVAMLVSTTHDQEANGRIQYIVSELAECQQKNGNGYVSAIPNGAAMFAQVAAGHGNGVLPGWVPWYTTHKVLAGLRDCYLLTGNEQAKTVLIGLSDWAVVTTSTLTHDQWQIMLGQEHGGMNEVLADVYAITGDSKYLDTAKKFHQDAVLTPLENQKDDLNGLHANTQIPKIIGLARIYELTGDNSARTGSDFFWHRMVDTRSYVIGGNSEFEHLGAANALDNKLGVSTCETCNTYNMLKLTRHLFQQDPSEEYAAYYERALFNDIHASQEPAKGMVTYFMSLKPGHFKTYSTPTESFWCCVGTGMENHVKYGEAIYFHTDKDLYINLFLPSKVVWKEKGLTVTQETTFPDKDTTRLKVTADNAVDATLKIRYPSWCNGLGVRVNGKPIKITSDPGSYVDVPGRWKTGDVIDIHLPMHLHQEALPDNPNKVALLYGPIVLAGQLGKQGIQTPIPYAKDQWAYANVSDPAVPVFVHDADLTQYVKPVEGQSLTFRTDGIGHPQDLTLKPFYSTYYDRYTVYLESYSPEAWKVRQAEYDKEQAQQRILDARTVDTFRPGDQQFEVDHKLASDQSNTGAGPADLSGPVAVNYGWRDASNGGWFSFQMKADPAVTQDLICTYWGSDAGNRSFDIQVDGTTIGSETLNNDNPGRYFDKTYPIPADLTRGKNLVTVKLQAKPGAMAGGLFGCRIVRHE